MSGIGKFSISYFLKDKNGCTNTPFIEINVKECKINCPKADTAIRNLYVCDSAFIGTTDTQRFKSQVNNCDSFVLIRIYNPRQTPAPRAFCYLCVRRR
ncbi:MAG: hypothetical protein HC817_15030 [Saprospiraceae bacterium]|nr:hypothetical protein [Saprospiraceae bacterium]